MPTEDSPQVILHCILWMRKALIKVFRTVVNTFIPPIRRWKKKPSPIWKQTS